MNEQDVRNKAKAWIVKNNNQLAHLLGEDGLMKLVEEAFIAGSEDTTAKDDRIDDLEMQVDDLYSQLDDLESQLNSRDDEFNDLKDRLNLSVESIR